MLVEHVAYRPADAERRVERGAGILRHVGDEPAPQLPGPRLPAHVDLLAGDADGALDDADARARVAEQREGRRRLAGARLADEPEDLAGRDGQGDVLDHRLARGELDAQAVDGERRRRGAHGATDGAAERARDRVADHVERDREQRDHRRGDENDPRVERQPLAVLADDQRPVGGRRLQPEAEEVDRRDEDDRVGEAQADVGRDRRDDVRQDLAPEDREGALPSRDRGLDEAADGLLERRGADDAGDERRLHEGHARDERRLTRADSGDQHEDEEQCRDRDQHVGAAHEQRVHVRAAVAGDEPDDAPRRVRDQGREPRESKHAPPAPEHT